MGEDLERFPLCHHVTPEDRVAARSVGLAKLMSWTQDRSAPKRTPAVMTLHHHPSFSLTADPQ